MRDTISRAQRFEDSRYRGRWWRLSRRFYRRVQRRVAKCLGVDVGRIRYDPYDNSIEVYACDHGRRLTRAESDRIFGMGVATCWLNSDRQQVTYSLHRGWGREPRVDVTTCNEWRELYPDAIVSWRGELMTLAESDARRVAEKAKAE